MKALFAALAVVLLLFGPSAWAQDTVRIGIFVGNNIGLGQDEPLRSAEREARDLALAFQQLGDVSRERSYVLTGANSVELERTLRTVDGQVREAQARGSKVLLLFYYSGHASREGLHLRGSVLPMSRLRNWLDRQAADVRVAFVDACESGTLARVRGGIPVETIDLTISDTLGTTGLAVITSSGPLSVARESEQFGGGVFSQALISGLRGAADTDENGAVTLEEAYEFSFSETVRDTAKAGHGVQRPEFRRSLTGVGDVVLTRLADRSAGLVLPPELEGVYTVVSVNTGQVVARIDKQPGEHKRLALPSGRYVVRKVRQVDVLVAELDLAWGGDRWVDDARMTTVALGDPLSRGAAPFDRPHRFWIAGSRSSPTIQRGGKVTGFEFGTRLRLANKLGLTATVSGEYSYKAHATADASLVTLRGAVGLNTELRIRRLNLVIGGSVHALQMHQLVAFEWFRQGPGVGVPVQTTVAGSADADLHLPITGTVGLIVGGKALIMPVNVDERLQIRGQLRGHAGLMFKFGGKGMRELKRNRKGRAPKPETE